jgi:hypothetical protein
MIYAIRLEFYASIFVALYQNKIKMKETFARISHKNQSTLSRNEDILRHILSRFKSDSFAFIVWDKYE